MKKIQYVSGPAVWNTHALESMEPMWLRQLDDNVCKEIAAETRRVFAQGLRMGKADFELRTAAPILEDAKRSLEEKAGFVLLRGLPTESLSIEQLETMLWGIGAHIGHAVRQTLGGTLVAQVRDRGNEEGGELARGHQTNAELAFHTDRCDVLALFCVRPAKEGGLSALASAGWIHNRLLEESPAVLKTLYESMPHDLRGAILNGDKPWANIPVFSYENGEFVSRYIRKFIEGSQRFPEAPPLTEEQDVALDAVDEVLSKSKNTFEFEFEPGDLLLINNYTVWHSRTRFVDWEEPEKKRLLLRLWLSPDNTRTLPESFQPLYGRTEAGAIRGGFPQ